MKYRHVDKSLATGFCHASIAVRFDAYFSSLIPLAGAGYTGWEHSFVNKKQNKWKQ